MSPALRAPLPATDITLQDGGRGASAKRRGIAAMAAGGRGS
ncbi:hypothetical protein [Aquincola sp. J276]|nr:hypothetical protein [Aquincola sp. J276]